MSFALQLVTAVCLAVVSTVLVFFLLQARRTAHSVMLLAESARTDLSRMTEEVHQLRVRMDALADQVQQVVDVPARLGSAAVSLAEAVPGFFKKQEPAWLHVLTTVAQAILPLFRK